VSVEIKLSARAIPGQRWKVKSNPITRKYGVRARGSNEMDCKAWPGEIGTIEERTWGGKYEDGTEWVNSGMWINFERGRSTNVDIVELANFLRVKP